MKRKICLSLLALLLLLSACGREKGLELTIYRVVAPYYRDSGELIRAESFTVVPAVGSLNSAVAAFNSEPVSQQLWSPLPAGGQIIGYEQRGGTLRLFVEGCDELEGLDLTLLRCCATLTFCSIDGVSSVSIYSGIEELCPPLSRNDIQLTDIYQVE